HFITVVEDIEERKRTEAQIAALNTRLQRAMTETHHRVKNNLQIIASMVDMQILDGRESLPIEEVRRLRRHVQTLAAVHDLLTDQAKADGSAQCVSARAVLVKLVPLLREAVSNRQIRMSQTDATVTARQGTSIALVANELINNAIKHGAGDVCVGLTSEGETATLEVTDGGPGFPAGFDQSQQETTGLELVTSLARWDLNGDVAFDNVEHGGARVRVTFPLADPRPDS
ncbi:MAG TPA: sensor histidine kinase, partial [Chthonomonadales bacterium]|nr:sensor histidine kinase [Chthonomonadales bacterium]